MRLDRLFFYVLLMLGVCGPAVPDASAALVAFWDFQGTFADSAASPLPTLATAGNTGGITAAGQGAPPGGAASRGFLTANSPSALYASPGTNTKLEIQSFTVEAWIKPTGTLSTANQTLFSYEPKGDPRGYAIRFIPSLTAGASLITFLKGDGASFTSAVSTAPVTIASNQWQHLAVSYHNPTKTVNFFFNGLLVGQTVMTGGSIVYADDPGLVGPNPKSLFIGTRYNAANSGPTIFANWLNSIATATNIDRVRIHDVAFTANALGEADLRLDYYYIPEPTTAAMVVWLGAMALFRHKRWRA